MAEDSLLTRKWQEKAVNFQGVKKRALKLVPELGPSFEQVEREIIEEETGRKAKTKYK
jgi:hypothetical protein